MSYGEIPRTQRVFDRLHKFATTPSRNLAERAIRGATFAVWMTYNVSAHPNSRGHRGRAAANLWTWQVLRRVVKKPVIVELSCGARLRCPPWSGMTSAWVSIGYHEEELLFVIDALSDGDGFVDVGANIGIYSMCAAARGAKVVAFEPVAAARNAFEANVALNGYGERVQVLDCALSDENTSLRITSNLESSNHLVRNGESGSGEIVSVRRLDDLVAERRDVFPERISVVKVDAEGFDANVLRGAGRTLAEHRPAVVVEIWAGGREVRDALEPLGYAMLHYDAKSHGLERLQADFKTDGYFVAVHESRVDETRERLRRARTVDRTPSVRWFPNVTP